MFLSLIVLAVLLSLVSVYSFDLWPMFAQVTKERLVAQLVSASWRQDEAEEVYGVLCKFDKGGKGLWRPQLLKFNPAELRLIFDEMDHSKDDKLDAVEIENGMKHMGLEQSEYRMLFQSIDVNGDRLVSQDEYIHFQLNYWLYRQRMKKSASAMKYVKAAHWWEVRLCVKE